MIATRTSASGSAVVIIMGQIASKLNGEANMPKKRPESEVLQRTIPTRSYLPWST